MRERERGEEEYRNLTPLNIGVLWLKSFLHSQLSENVVDRCELCEGHLVESVSGH